MGILPAARFHISRVGILPAARFHISRVGILPAARFHISRVGILPAALFNISREQGAGSREEEPTHKGRFFTKTSGVGRGL
ncbi:MAG: hypothetical protein F6K26_15560 [Moorea sp. SIO2I5]|nr:hypothetical protein [Moorena sp. SIO2I5]